MGAEISTQALQFETGMACRWPGGAGPGTLRPAAAQIDEGSQWPGSDLLDPAAMAQIAQRHPPGVFRGAQLQRRRVPKGLDERLIKPTGKALGSPRGCREGVSACMRPGGVVDGVQGLAQEGSWRSWIDLKGCKAGLLQRAPI